MSLDVSDKTMPRVASPEVQRDGARGDMLRLLDVAERYEGECQEVRERMGRLAGRYLALMLGVICWALAILPFLSFVLSDISLDTSLFASYIVTTQVIVAIVVGLSTVFFFRRRSALRTQLKGEERALAEVVRLLREVEGAIAEAEDWSTLERAEFRIRLSRFDMA